MPFDQQKISSLAKGDKSIKGSIDTKIKPLVNLINKKKNFYTTSSCSGRTVLLEKEGREKLGVKWLLVNHDTVIYPSLKKALQQPFQKKLWFKFESFILHVCCRTLEDANQLLKQVMSLGLKRSGIITAEKRFIIEIIGTQSIEALIGMNNKLLASDNLLQALLEEAKRKMEINDLQIKQCYHEFMNL